MKGLINFQGNGSVLAHAITLILKEEYGLKDFSAYCFTPFAVDFIKKQQDIQYDPVLIDHEVHAKIHNTEIDWDYIKNFENTYQPNGWLLIYQDRKLMMSMGPKDDSTMTIDPFYDHAKLVKSLQVRAQAIEKMLTESKPNFILFFYAGGISQSLLLIIAKKLNIRTFTLDACKIGSRVAISEHYNTITGAVEDFEKFKLNNEHSTPYHVEALQILKNFKETGSLNLEYVNAGLDIYKRPKKENQIKKIIKTLRYLLVHHKNYKKFKGLFLYHDADKTVFTFIFHKLRRKWRAWQGMEDLYSKPDLQEEYLFYPLHYEPEHTISTLSPFYTDQLTIIRYLARSVPLQYKIYVKDHPFADNNRPRSYFKELLKIPNVKLLDPDTNSFNIIKNAKIVAAIAGTAGWEAALLNKPVITFGNIFYNALSTVKRIQEVEKLPEIIFDLVKNFQPNQQELLDMIAALLKNSFDFNYSTLRDNFDINELKKDSGVQNLCKNLMDKMKQEKISLY